jgi:hypothetical protein
MAFRIKISEVNIEEVRNGRNKYDKAEVNYTFKGEARTQKIMSFANPGVFPLLRKMKPGEEYDVEVTKDDKGYNTWAKVVAVSNEPAPVASGAVIGTGMPGAASGRVSISTYETAEERKIKQLYIIRQSSISNAIQYMEYSNMAANVDSVLDVAQQFVDFVYGNNDGLHGRGESLEEMVNDLLPE